MRRNQKLYRLVFTAVMAAIVWVVTLLKFPLFGSNMHFGNAMCLLGGLLFGPVTGGLSAGIGSMLYDAISGGYSIDQALITLVSKGLMGAVAGLIAHWGGHSGEKRVRNVVGSVCGALTYVCLYMLKTLVYQHFVYGNTWQATYIAMGAKLPASLINAAVAVVVAPILAAAIRPALARGGMMADKK